LKIPINPNLKDSCFFSKGTKWWGKFGYFP